MGAVPAELLLCKAHTNKTVILKEKRWELLLLKAHIVKELLLLKAHI